MARTGGYRRSAVWRPCGVTPHTTLQNKSIVCSGSQVTISTVMKLHWSVKRGGIIVNVYKEHLLTQWHRNNIKVPHKQPYGHTQTTLWSHTNNLMVTHNVKVTKKQPYGHTETTLKSHWNNFKVTHKQPYGHTNNFKVTHNLMVTHKQLQSHTETTSVT